MNSRKTLGMLLMAALLLIGCNQNQKDTDPWKPMFDGTSITNWKQLGGNAKYEVRDGAIVGTTVSETLNSFLTDGKIYDDFIMELDFKVDSSMNSGIQIRSKSYPQYRNGRVHGYQVEIDPSDRAWSGGIFDEARRGWLHPILNNTEAQKSFKQNEWNHFRIEFIGDSLKTWINGNPASFLIDDMDASGFIAFQVHGIHGEKKPGTEIAWKNINIITEDVAKYTKKSPLKPVITKNRLTYKEKTEGWKLLWDGETTNGWRGGVSRNTHLIIKL